MTTATLTAPQRAAGLLALAAYAAVPVAANWMIANVGYQPAPGAPHMLPVWAGLLAPSGVYAAGLAFSLRDAVRERYGASGALSAVLAGALVSWLVSSPALALASAAAFLLSELLDSIVYERLRSAGRARALLASNAAGLVADSALFLWLAFGSLDLLVGQVVGKVWMTLLVAALVWARGMRR